MLLQKVECWWSNC